MLTIKEENDIDTSCQINMTSIQLLQFKHGRGLNDFPSSFSLIKYQPIIDAKYVILQHMQQRHFPVLQYKIKELVDFAVKLIKTSSFVKNKISDKILHKMVSVLASKYNSVAYHNFSHAFTLTMLNYQCLLKDHGLKNLYTEEQYFYIMIAGLAHDLNHKGTNNSFQVKTGSDLAKISANQSVLENMHLRTLWSILEEETDINFLRISTCKVKAKQIITRLILNTDMALHSTNIQLLRNLRKAQQFNPKQNYEHKWILMEHIFHGCDIGNSWQEYGYYISWAALLTHEFNQQAKLEEKLNLKVTQGFVYKDLKSLYKDQIWFLGDVVLPMWKQISQICPALRQFVENIRQNQMKVKQQLLKLTS